MRTLFKGSLWLWAVCATVGLGTFSAKSAFATDSGTTDMLPAKALCFRFLMAKPRHEVALTIHGRGTSKELAELEKIATSRNVQFSDLTIQSAGMSEAEVFSATLQGEARHLGALLKLPVVVSAKKYWSPTIDDALADVIEQYPDDARVILEAMGPIALTEKIQEMPWGFEVIDHGTEVSRHVIGLWVRGTVAQVKALLQRNLGFPFYQSEFRLIEVEGPDASATVAHPTERNGRPIL